mmetsp:Transcript_31501/g.102643  ORF Transcript_31501/g.102643 Transcript_31501/m.102643 type:complete len:234 (-) Transcript_31501:13-714(-)
MENLFEVDVLQIHNLLKFFGDLDDLQIKSQTYPKLHAQTNLLLDKDQQEIQEPFLLLFVLSREFVYYGEHSEVDIQLQNENQDALDNQQQLYPLKVYIVFVYDHEDNERLEEDLLHEYEYIIHFYQIEFLRELLENFLKEFLSFQEMMRFDIREKNIPCLEELLLLEDELVEKELIEQADSLKDSELQIDLSYIAKKVLEEQKEDFFFPRSSFLFYMVVADANANAKHTHAAH